MGEETLGKDEVEIVLRAGHRDVQQSTFLLDLGGSAGADIGGDAAVHRVQDEDRLPLLPLCRVDRGQDQIVLIAQWYARLIACGIWRIESELRQKPLAGRITRRDLLQ